MTLTLLAVAITALFYAKKSLPHPSRQQPSWKTPSACRYTRKVQLLNRSEYALHKALTEALPTGYSIQCKVRIADLIDVTGPDRESRFQHTRPMFGKHVDFVVCDNTSRPVCAIELNGLSHLLAERIQRDKFVDNLFKEAGMPLHWVRVGKSFASEATRIMATV